METRDECAVVGCNLIRKPAPKSPRYKRSKYCVDHAAEAKARFRGSYDVDSLFIEREPQFMRRD